MVRNKVVAGIVVLALVVAGAGYGYSKWSSSGSSKKKDLVILSEVTRQTLQDTVTLNGTLARQELRKVTSVSQGRMSAVYAKDGATAQVGEKLFAIDGRDAVAEPGDVRFFRPLTVGDRGDDVLQLKRVLAAAGNSPGPMNTVFTESTRFALAQWQAQHHYPGATPVTPQTVTVTLGQGTGYTLGAQTAAGLTIGGGGAQTTAARSAPVADVVHKGVLTAFRRDISPFAIPVVRIQSSNAVVPEGAPITFTIGASPTPTSDLVVNLAGGGTATSSDIMGGLPSSITIPAGTATAQVTIQTRIDNVVKPKKTLTLALLNSVSYTLGNPSSALTTITNNNLPAMRIAGATTISPGGSARLTVTSDQPTLHDTQVSMTLAGDAVPGTDYRSVNPVVLIRKGQTSASVAVNTLTSSEIQPSKHIVASITPSPSAYTVGSPGIAVITITGAQGSASLPILTLRSAQLHLTKGEPYVVTVSLNKAVTNALTVVLAYGGNAAQGRDFTLPGGSIVVPPGMTSATVQIPTVQDKVVESDRVLIVALASSSSYRIGAPRSARVTIESQIMPELTLTGSTESVGVGGAARFTITADQPPVKNTSVSYQVLGTAQPGQDFEPLVGTTVLKAGQRAVVVTLRSIQKDVSFLPTDMVVANWPIRVGQVFVKEGDPLPPGTPVLSLTDPNFTVTLQASATDRTKLKVGQHCTVQLVGGQTEEPGTISELDSNLTSLDAATPGGAQQQVYEGKIQVGDLGAADGASVTIKVVDQERLNALTVPIAAVKQNGKGEDVVRVIDIEHAGKVTEVPVQTGLTEGSYIEVTKGLTGNETVISEVDQPQ